MKLSDMRYLIIISCLFLCGCSKINQKLGLRDDNLFEEMAEKTIEKKTGLDIDITPSTPES